MQLIATYDSNYNETALTEASKFPSLTTGPMTLTLQVNNEFYTARIKYNSVTKWFTLDIIGPNNKILQGETFVSGFPTNLIVAPKLKEYGLFYFPRSKKFKFYKLTEKWYNTFDMDYETLLKAIEVQAFPSEFAS